MKSYNWAKFFKYVYDLSVSLNNARWLHCSKSLKNKIFHMYFLRIFSTFYTCFKKHLWNTASAGPRFLGLIICRKKIFIYIFGISLLICILYEKYLSDTTHLLNLNKTKRKGRKGNVSFKECCLLNSRWALFL